MSGSKTKNRCKTVPSFVDLHQALRSRDLTSIEELLSTGINVNVPLRGTTPLSLSIITNAERAAQLLIKHGADVNQRSRDHLDRLEPPLFTACRLGLDPIVKLLVKFHADVNKPDFYGQSPLWVAVRERRLDLVQLLLENGAKLGRVSSWSECPLYLATKLYFGRREIAILLVRSGCPANFVDSESRNCLFWALKHRDKELATLLMAAGARPMREWDWGGFEGDEGFLGVLKEEMSSPVCLKGLCRLCVRRRLVEVNCGIVEKFVEELSVPRLIKDFLNLEVG